MGKTRNGGNICQELFIMKSTGDRGLIDSLLELYFYRLYGIEILINR